MINNNMLKRDDLELIYERILLKEYSEPFIRKEAMRFRRQAPVQITNDMIRQTIVRFDQLKTGIRSGERIKEIINELQPDEEIQNNPKELQRFEKLKKSPFEITFYSWKDLEHVVHQFSDPAERKAIKALAAGENPGATLIKETDNGLKIYWGRDAKECIAFGRYLNKKNEQGFKDLQGKIPYKPGEVYNWCIGSTGSNQFDAYRFRGEGHGASVYYVVDESLPLSDPMHVIVIHAQQNGKYRLTRAFNSGGEPVAGWSTVLEWQPKLSNFKDLIKFHPYTEDEEIHNQLKYVTSKTFHTLTTFKAKKAFINSGKMLLSNDYLELDSELQHLYISVKCGPDALDTSVQARMHKTLYLFADSGQIPGNGERIRNARFEVIDIVDDSDLTDEEYDERSRSCPFKGTNEDGTPKEKCNCGQTLEPYYDDPIVKQSKNNQTYRLWKKFVHSVVNAWLNDAKEQRGYAEQV